MAIIRNICSDRNATAWLLLMAALALHVVDETVTDFLPFYNHVVLVLREQLGFFPMPTFSFPLWLGGPIFWLALGFAVTPVVHRGGKPIRVLTIVVGVLMALNGLNHMIGSVYLGRLLPGFWSSPLLLVVSIWVVLRGVRRDARSWSRPSTPTTQA